MAQWRERSPPTNVAWLQFRPVVMCLLLVLPLFLGFFSRFTGYSPSTNNQHSKFQFAQDENQQRVMWLPILLNLLELRKWSSAIKMTHCST